MKPLFELCKNTKVGIWDGNYVARIYSDKIILSAPYVRWTGNSGNYAIERISIRDQKTIDRVLIEMKDGATDTAWQIILNG